jgi:hypothetical protein
MRVGFKYSKLHIAAAAAGTGAACAAVWLHIVLGGETVEERRRGQDSEGSLTAQIAAKSMYGNARLSALRDEVARSSAQLGGKGSWESLVGRLGNAWACETETVEGMDAYPVRYGTFRLASPAVADWSAIVEAVGNSEAIPGVGIAEIEMKSSGDRTRRSLDLVRIQVAVQTSRAERLAPISQ